jgi:PAS domain S-box-containing protein
VNGVSTSAEQPDRPPLAASSAPRAVGSLLDVLRVGIVMFDGQGHIVMWSPMTERILGWPDSLVVARPLADFVVGPDPVAPGRVAGLVAALLDQGSWRGELPMRHLDGSVVELECRASLLRDPDGSAYFLANLVETSRVRAIERDLGALDALFNTSPLGIALFDTDRRFIRINDALAKLYGSSSAELLGKTVLDVLPAHMSHEVYELQRQVLHTGRSVVDLVTLSPDRHGARSLSFSRLTDRTGRVIGVSAIIIDITERREALDKIEQARQRLALLDDVGVALGDRLDVRRIAEALAHVLVPRFSDYSGVMLLDAVVRGGELPAPARLATSPLLQVGVAAKRHTPTVDRMLRVGEAMPFDRESVFDSVLHTGHPWLIDSRDELLAATYPGDPKVQAALDLDIHSMMVIPLRARGTVLGVLLVSRAGRRTPFSQEDLALANEIASRAATSLDNARLYARERKGALMLQRSLLPQRVPEPPGVQVSYRYVPSSTGAEVGGDWFDAIALTGGRVALVVGDVMGHGLRAAATMGRLRTAVRALAGLDLPPAELLCRVNAMSDDFAQGPDDPLMATCLYAVYDPAARLCTLAKAGHVPPVLLSRAERTGLWHAEQIELDHGLPLGVTDAEYRARQIEVPDGSVLVLYTDGLVERRGEDLSDGIDRLCSMLGRTRGASPSLEQICDKIIHSLAPPPSAAESGSVDDIALLTARLGVRNGADHSVSWTFPAESQAVRRARALVRQTLRTWRLEQLTDPAVLLVSELVTNSLRYAHGPIGVRMVRGTTLLVEVSDPLSDPPRARRPTVEEEGGRGLQLVSREALRWGTRQGPIGKTVWFELGLPG